MPLNENTRNYFKRYSKFYLKNDVIDIVFDKKKIETSPIIKHIMEKCTIQDVRLYEPDLEGTIRKIYERKG